MSGSSRDYQWQLSCAEWKKRGAHLLNTGQLSDCTFSVGGVTQRAHRLVLAAASPVFEAMLYGPMVEASSNNPITIPDMAPEIFKILLEYMYTDDINIDSFNSAYDLYYGAQKYMLPHLATVCASYISSNLTPKIACKAYELGRLFREEDLMKESLEVIRIKTKEVLKDNSLLDVQLETLEMIFTQENLDIDSELELFNAAERYIQGHSGSPRPKPIPVSKSIESVVCVPPDKKKKVSRDVEQATPSRSTRAKNASKDTNTDPISTHGSSSAKLSDNDTSQEDSESSENDREEKARKAARLLQHIRLLTLSPSAFAAGPARSPLLPPRDAFALIMRVSHPATDAPLPPGYSASRWGRTRIPRAGESYSHHVFIPVACLSAGAPDFRSGPFYILDYSWELVLKRFLGLDLDEREVEYLSVGLACRMKPKHCSGWVKVHANLKLARSWDPEPVLRNLNIEIRPPENHFGEVTNTREKFIRWNKLVDPQRGFVVNDHFTLETQLQLEAVDVIYTSRFNTSKSKPPKTAKTGPYFTFLDDL